MRLPSGELLAVHDYFGPGSPRNHEGVECLSSVYRSADNGASWQGVTHIVGAFWSTLFVLHKSVYLLGTSAQYGSIVIRRSDDGGRTWTHPADARTGLLFRGGPGGTPPNYHTAPVPVVIVNGRLYRAFENLDPLNWPADFRAFVISCPVDADLLDAANWRMSNQLAYDQAIDPPEWGSPGESGTGAGGRGGANGGAEGGAEGAAHSGAEGGRAPARVGWLEGNVVVAPNGEIWNVLRVHSLPVTDRAVIVRVEDEGRRVTSEPFDWIELPGGHSKFTIRRDQRTGMYWTLSNPNVDRGLPMQRNRLCLYSSVDLRHWRWVRTLMGDDGGLGAAEAARQIGYQYVDWQFDGEDIIYVVRTAWGGAHDYHDANRITFGRIERFRTLS